jgi:hypothetical protein
MARDTIWRLVDEFAPFDASSADPQTGLTQSNDFLQRGRFRHHVRDKYAHDRPPGWSLEAMGPCRFLFTSGATPALGISDDDFRSAASELGIDLETIGTVADVETKSNPIRSSGASDDPV